MARYCNRCGKSYPRGAAYCAFCGHALGTPAVPPRIPPAFDLTAGVVTVLIAVPLVFGAMHIARHSEAQAAATAESAPAPVVPVAPTWSPAIFEPSESPLLVTPADYAEAEDVAPRELSPPRPLPTADEDDPAPPPAGDLPKFLTEDIDPHQFDALSTQGTWQQDDNGRTWKPDPDEVGDDFEPYVTDGQWSLSDQGWVFLSSFSWGWATFHYGQWSFAPQRGWVWSPGTKWAAAWVVWMQAPQGMVGWQPSAPKARAVPNIAHGMPTWHFMAASDLPRPDIRSHLVSAVDIPTLLAQSKPAPIAHRGPSEDYLKAAEVEVHPVEIAQLAQALRPKPAAPPPAPVPAPVPEKPAVAEVIPAAKPEPPPELAAPVADEHHHRHEAVIELIPQARSEPFRPQAAPQQPRQEPRLIILPQMSGRSGRR